MANNEVDKIAELKARVDEETVKVKVCEQPKGRREGQEGANHETARANRGGSGTGESTDHLVIILEQDHELKKLRAILLQRWKS